MTTPAGPHSTSVIGLVSHLEANGAQRQPNHRPHEPYRLTLNGHTVDVSPSLGLTLAWVECHDERRRHFIYTPTDADDLVQLLT